MATQYLIVPGLGNSGPRHWQSYFEQTGENFKRIQQAEWDAPECSDWIKVIEQHVAAYPAGEVVLIGHSLGCTAIAHWANSYQKLIKGALLVAPSDIEAQGYTFPAKGFAPIPLDPLPFPSTVVASTDDPWVTPARAAYFAHKWGSRFVNIGKAGHINADSGHYQWKEGMALLKQLGE